jgi:Fe-Mn family superoxide dismutase
MRKLMMILAIAALPFSGFSQKNNNKKDIAMTTINKLEFHNLPYAYDALEPFIDKMTMEIHHSKHHKAYYDNMMNAVKGTDMEGKTLEEVFANMSKYPAAVRNNGGGYYNHNLYWEVMKVNGGKPSAKLEAAIVKTFESMDELKKQFTDAGKTRFGSGWAWLSVDKDGKLFVSSTPNQDNPLMDVAEKHGTPILGMDVWEHAYYLKYQNKRPDYTEAFWNVINWEAVSKKYDSIVK